MISEKRAYEIESYYNENGLEQTLTHYKLSEDTFKRYLRQAKSCRKGIDNVAETSDLDLSNVKHGWIKDKNHSVFFTNPKHTEPTFDPDLIDWKEILKPLNISKKDIQYNEDLSGEFDRVVYTDTHIGMTPNKDGFSLYGGKWDEEELMSRLNLMLSHILSNQSSNKLILDDLGDFMDGWGGHTVRRQHPLPQNMDDQKAFDVGLSFKLKMIDVLSSYYSEITCNNVCNDNHAGAFGYVVNSAFKEVCKSRYENVDVFNRRKFIEHYKIGKHIFIITHGKDGENLKFGFKPKLDAQQSEKIDNYIKENYLHEKGVDIEFSKGDSHQFIFDLSTSDSFNYFNYPAFSPSSEWVQTNYKKGKSGFVMFNYFKSQVSYLPYFFKWHESMV